jgi:WD40 repeat protein
MKSLIDSLEKPVNFKGVFSCISRNGNFVYLNNTWNRRFTIYNLESKKKHSKDWQHSRSSHLVVVKDGVILYDKKASPELWNSDLSQHLASFHQLAGAKQCLSVSDELIACVYRFHVIFFNVFTKEIESTTDFKEEVRLVMACGIRYHVLAQIESSNISLWKEGTRVDGWEDSFDRKTLMKSRHITCAVFSPTGNRLAFFSLQINKIFIFDIILMKFLSQIPIYGPSNDLLRLIFLDNKNLVCSSTNRTIYLLNVENSEILTCVDFGDIPAPIAVSHEKGIVFVGVNRSKHFALIKVHLSRKL